MNHQDSKKKQKEKNGGMKCGNIEGRKKGDDYSPDGQTHNHIEQVCSSE